MADTALTGSVYKKDVSADGALAITIPSDAAAVIVIVGGYKSTDLNAPLLDELNFDDGATLDFALIAHNYFSAGSADTVLGAYIMTQDSGDWPGYGAKTLYYGETGGIAEGYTFQVFFVTNIDATPANVIVDVDSLPYVSAFDPWISALVGVGAADLGIVCSWDVTGSNIDVTTAGQTIIDVTNGTQDFNSAGCSIGYEVGESALVVDYTTDKGAPLAFAIKNGTDAGVPEGTIPVDFIVATSATYEPVVISGEDTIPVDFIAVASVVYEPVVISGEGTISVGFIASTSTTYEPVVISGEGTISVDFIASTSATYEPSLQLASRIDGQITLTITVDGTMVSWAQIDVGHIASTSVTYEPTLIPGGIQLIDFIASTSITYEPSLTSGEVTIPLDYVASTSVTYGPTLIHGGELIDFIASTSVIYEPTLIPGELTIPLDYVTSASVAYALEVEDGEGLFPVDFISSATIVPDPLVHHVAFVQDYETMTFDATISRTVTFN